MNFFENQDRARKKTGWLVILFIMAVIAITVTISVIALIALSFTSSGGQGSVFPSDSSVPKFIMVGVISIFTLVVIGGGSIHKIMQLRGGGHVVAESLGGRLLMQNTTDPSERKILNIVEEMAIASGTPCPPVYFLSEEKGINAFAAGYSPDDAVIGITRGCVESLTRDELQGVVAHEFSHILNGDMRLNIKLIGVLHGILMIGIIGYFILRAGAYSRRGNKGVPALLLIGAGLAAVGYLGTFFGTWIKSALSRQREYLADASAVQFTRNPSGIGGALKRIGGSVSGALIDNPNAPQASHMFFGQGIRSHLQFIFATHPPLTQRIHRIEPDWDGKYLKPLKRKKGKESKTPPQKRRIGQREMLEILATGAIASSIDSIGQPTQHHLDYARQVKEMLPDELVSIVEDMYGARAVIYTLLLSHDENVRSRQLQLINQQADRGIPELVTKLIPVMDQVPIEARLPLIEKTISSLRHMSPAQYHVFRQLVDALISADQQIDLFEWMLQRILMRHLNPHFEKFRATAVHYYSLSRLGRECSLLLSMLAYVGHKTQEEARSAFNSATEQLRGMNIQLQPPEKCGLDHVDSALDKLASVAPQLKRQIVAACIQCISFDREAQVKEVETLRAICDALGCPMPPLLPGQKLI